MGLLCLEPTVNREYSNGLRTDPCGAPVFRTNGEEVRLPTLTICDLSLRKSKIHRVVGIDRGQSVFCNDFEGMCIVLNAEL